MPSQPITDDHFKKLLEETARENNKVIAMRDTLIYEITLFLGLRPGECRLIEISHINFLSQEIFIPADNNKERNEDDVFIPDFLWNKIRVYLELRKIKSKWLFPCILHHCEKKDIVLDEKTMQWNFTNRLKNLGILKVSFIDKQGKPRYNYNLYSLRKRFGTFVYKKTRCPQTTALLLRQYDKQLKSVWRYIFAVEKEERKEIMQEIYN